MITGTKGFKMKAQREDTNKPTEHTYNAYSAIGCPKEMPLQLSYFSGYKAHIPSTG